MPFKWRKGGDMGPHEQDEKSAPDNTPIGSGFEPGLGDPHDPAPRFVCPHGDFSWARSFIGEPIPLCPAHKVPLIRARKR